MKLAPGTTSMVLDRVFPSSDLWTPKDRPPLEPHQIPPAGEWDLWLLEAGRGAGKTEACARYFTAKMRQNPGWRGRIIAPTYSDAVEACIEGPSGLKSIDPEVTWVPSAPGGSKVMWPNGSEALVLGTPHPRDVDRLRAGGNRHLDWWEEMAANVHLEDAWAQAEFGLRLGDRPHSIGSTTPRNRKAYREVRDLSTTVLTHASIDDNPHLNDDWRDRVKAKYEGTRLGQQELDGLLLTDVAGALWTLDFIDAGRVEKHPDLVTVAIAIDPAATSGPTADDTGMVAGGVGVDGHVYVLKDLTCHLPPDKWGDRAVEAFYDLKADYIVGEVNNGGEMVDHVIRTSDPTVPFVSVNASRGKQTRAQPVASLYGNEKRPAWVHHVGVFDELEEQQTTWVPGEDKSPDRMDALVWLVTDLLLTQHQREELLEDYDPVTIGPQI